MIARGEVRAFDDATARKTEDAGVKVGQVFHKVGAHAVPIVFGYQAHVVDIDRLSGHEEDTQQAFLNGFLGYERCRVLLPFVVCHGDGVAADGLVAFVDKFYAELCLFTLQGVQTSVDREVVTHIFFESHTEETSVLKSRLFFAVS